MKKNGRTEWSPTLKTKDEARTWRSSALGEIIAGPRATPSAMTLRGAWDEWLTGVKSGTIRNTPCPVFKPGTIRTYDAAWARRDPQFAAHKFRDLRRPDLQTWLDEFAQQPQQRKNREPDDPPLYPSHRVCATRSSHCVRSTAARSTWSVSRSTRRPAFGPRPDKRRERIVAPEEARELLGLLPADLRPLRATAFYAGLRLGELMALRWTDVDLDARVIHVRRSWDDKEGAQDPKSKAGRRKVPIIDLLAEHLKAQEEATGRSGTDNVFGRSTEVPFSKMGNYSRSRTA